MKGEITMKKIENKDYIDAINNMRMRRKRLRVSIKELSDYLGISRSSLSQAEAFIASISDRTLELINKYLDDKEVK